jgi:hypothetical protein
VVVAKEVWTPSFEPPAMVVMMIFFKDKMLIM